MSLLGVPTDSELMFTGSKLKKIPSAIRFPTHCSTHPAAPRWPCCWS